MKYFQLTILFLISCSVNAQVNDSGEIIISRKNLISILDKFKETAPTVLYLDSTENRFLTSSAIFTKIDSTQFKIVELQQSLKMLHSKIDSLNAQKNQSIVMSRNFDENYKSNRVNTQRDTVWNRSQGSVIYATEKVAANKTSLDESKGNIDQLNQKIDRLIAQQLIMESAILLISAQKPKTVTDTIIIKPKKDIDEKLALKETPTIAEPTIETVVERKSEPVTTPEKVSEISDFEKLIVLYSNYSKAIYFENNSITVANDTASETLYGIIQILSQNPTVDVYLKGFASKSGSKAYNEKISLARTLEVKQHLISRGVSPDRILSYNPGIDYEASTPAEARRVTISFIVRK